MSGPEAWLEAVETCRSLNRHEVAAWARREFDADRFAAGLTGNPQNQTGTGSAYAAFLLGAVSSATVSTLATTRINQPLKSVSRVVRWMP